jgi:hypothetical protein
MTTISIIIKAITPITPHTRGGNEDKKDAFTVNEPVFGPTSTM